MAVSYECQRKCAKLTQFQETKELVINNSVRNTPEVKRKVYKGENQLLT